MFGNGYMLFWALCLSKPRGNESWCEGARLERLVGFPRSCSGCVLLVYHYAFRNAIQFFLYSWNRSWKVHSRALRVSFLTSVDTGRRVFMHVHGVEAQHTEMNMFLLTH